MMGDVLVRNHRKFWEVEKMPKKYQKWEAPSASLLHLWSQSINTFKERNFSENVKPESIADSYSHTIIYEPQHTSFFMWEMISHQGKLIKETTTTWWFSEEWEPSPPFPAVRVIIM